MSGAVFELFIPTVVLSDIGCEQLLSYSFTGSNFFYFLFFAGVLKIELFFFFLFLFLFLIALGCYWVGLYLQNIKH